MKQDDVAALVPRPPRRVFMWRVVNRKLALSILQLKNSSVSTPPGWPCLHFTDSESIVFCIGSATEHPWPVNYSSLGTHGSESTNSHAAFRGAQIWREHPCDLKIQNIKETEAFGGISVAKIAGDYTALSYQGGLKLTRGSFIIECSWQGGINHRIFKFILAKLGGKVCF